MVASKARTDRKLQVLVVDDDEGMLTTLFDILGLSGYEVSSASSGQKAIEHVRDHQPDCILMDIRMPDMHGIEAFHEIKRLAPESPVIFMTAYADAALVEEARREGAVAVVPKPLDLDHLLQFIERLTAQSRSGI